MPTGLNGESDSIMKKVLFFVMTIVILSCFVACDGLIEHTHSFGEWDIIKPATPNEKGEKARYCTCGERQSETIYYISDGQENKDVITVIDGYLVVNGIVTEHKVQSDPIISVIGGYVAVNGVKTEYPVALGCNHMWQTVTTAPTCAVGGYDTMTCLLCDKSVTVNETAKLNHSYSTKYSTDNDYHWFKCANCDATTNREYHAVDEGGECTICGIPTFATPGVVYDISADGTYADVIGYNGTATTVKIAEEYNGLPVRSIYFEAFYDIDTITSVVIPDSVTSIGAYAFYSCYNLSYIVIPDSVTSIAHYAFAKCSSLGSIVIGDSVTSIGTSAFESCYNLTSVVFSDSAISIGYHAFIDCTSLTSVVIPDSVAFIDGSVFKGCYNLQFNEYENCKYLGSKDNPYLALIEVTSRNRSSYKIHEDTKVVAGSAFRDCSRFTSIVIPDGVTSIGDYAFCDCYGLTSVVIGDSVSSIGDSAFYNCSALRDVYYTGSEQEWKAITIGSYNSPLRNATIHYNYVPEN